MVEKYIEQYCIVRSRDQGVIAGYVEAIEGQHVRVRDARQLYSWSSSFVLIELANKGPRRESEQSYSAPSTEPLLMLEACGVYLCSTEASKMIRDIKPTVCE